ncbi:glycosyl hydrolases family 2 sugar binding domain-containing protein [Fusarium pseudocircinatum]|uniref:Glycosyl hydrolases family 2 sugar binding domain-containing protein n=1 Tax=Fusarium pseudocircinatum TaxID=56676 RepID=A0A8H5L3U9_9HYPO|nr:glycosyl hydrolases family 2 sugar binding domain-containing protein [Fusarium pseudocircinatum]
MAGRTLLSLVAACLLLSPSSAGAGTRDNTNLYTSFKNPPVTSRPLFRYWLPDANTDASKVAEDIAGAGSIGAGGVEFVPFYQYGGHGGRYPPGADWATYGFGSPAFVDVLEQAAQAHVSHGLKMDFALGPNQGQGVPADPDEEGLQWDLVPFAIQIPANGSLDNPLPGWGAGKLVSLVTATVKSRETIKVGASPFPGASGTHIFFVLAKGSLVQHTDKVSSKGFLRYKFSETPDGTEQWAFAFYSKKSLIKNLKFNSNDTEHVYGNGSYTVDHFSAKGAMVTIRFWQDYILKNSNVRSLIKQCAGAGWEDSPEIISTIMWTPDIPKLFKRRHNYDILTYLPLIMSKSNNLAIQAGIVNDYVEILELCYRQYITTLRDWLDKNLGVNFRSQVSYNLPMDMGVNVPFVDIPEAESLGFHDNPDAYKQYIGPAVLAGKKVVSNELGAMPGRPYSQLPTELLFSADTAFTTNTNKFVLHGQPYSGNYYNTTWPGYTPFQYGFSELYSPRQPAWEHGLDEALGYLARAQHAMQIGVANLDVAIYNKVAKTDPLWTYNVYGDSDLESASYTYAYVTPANLKLPQAYIKNKVLAPETGDFKALVLPARSNITLQAIENIKKLAVAGLPVILVGSPMFLPTNRLGDEAKTWAAYKGLSKLPSVHQRDKGEVAATLKSLGLIPKVNTISDKAWKHARRRDSANGMDLISILGASQPSTGIVKIACRGVPYRFNAWTGAQEPVLLYTTDRLSRTINIPLSLAANQTTILVVSEKPLKHIHAPVVHIVKQPDGVLGAKVISNHEIELRATSKSSGGRVILSNGATHVIKRFDVPEVVELEKWTLTTEHWEAPSNFSDASAIASKRNSTYTLTAPLRSWTELGPELTNPSGLGYYSTSFTWPPSRYSTEHLHGAYVKFEPVKHAMKLWVNGKRLPPVDPRDPFVDLGHFLKRGENEIVAVVPTTMWNYVRSLLPRIRNAGDIPLEISTEDIQLKWPMPAKTDNGLVGRVYLVPYHRVTLRL